MNKSERNKLALFISNLLIEDQQNLVSSSEIGNDLKSLFEEELKNELSAYIEVGKIEFIVRSITNMFSLRCSPLILGQDRVLKECRSFSVHENFYYIVEDWIDIKYGSSSYLHDQFSKNDSPHSEFKKNFAEMLKKDEDWHQLLKEGFDEDSGYYKFMTGWYDGLGKQ